MMKLGPTIILICGILIFVSIFLPWFTVSANLGEFGNFTVSISAWNIISGNTTENGASASHTAELLTMVGGILMMVSALIIFLISLLAKEKKFASAFGALAVVSAVLSIAGVMKYMFSDMNVLYSNGKVFDYLGYGVYIALAFSILGLIFGFITLTKRPSPSCAIESSTGIAAPPAGTSRSVRDYYEKKAAAATQVSTPVQKTATKVIGATTISSLPPLPPTVDAAKSQECFGHACDFETAGNHDKAIEEYSKAIRFDARHTKAYFKRGLLLKAMSMKPAAISDFRRVIDISDSPELSEKAKSYIAEMK
jgi:tetratricopeptide (TPR) repeat protein